MTGRKDAPCCAAWGHNPRDRRCSWIALTRATPRGNWQRTWAIKWTWAYQPVVPPLSSRKQPWEYDRELYKRRNEIERLFRRLKAYRRIFTRYDKLDVIFSGFILFALIYEALR